MKRINLALVSDSIFIAFCAFLLTFVCSRFYIRPLAAVFSVAIASGIIFGVAAFALLYRIRAKKIARNAHLREKQNLALHLSVCGEKSILTTFENALDGTYPVSNRLESDETAYFFRFTLSPLSADDVASALKCEHEKSKVIFCCNAGEESLNLAQNFGVKVMQITEVYELLKGKNMLPEKYACGEIKRQTLRSKIKRRFNRKLCPSLFLCGLTLLLFSPFVLFRIYYVVCGGILLALASVSLFFDAK